MKYLLNVLYATYEIIVLQGIGRFLYWFMLSREQFRPDPLRLLLHEIVYLMIFDFYWWLIILVIYPIVFRKGFNRWFAFCKPGFAVCVAAITAMLLQHTILPATSYSVSFFLNLFSCLILMLCSENKLRAIRLSEIFKYKPGS
jgi:hypothetical protein